MGGLATKKHHKKERRKKREVVCETWLTNNDKKKKKNEEHPDHAVRAGNGLKPHTRTRNGSLKMEKNDHATRNKRQSPYNVTN